MPRLTERELRYINPQPDESRELTRIRAAPIREHVRRHRENHAILPPSSLIGGALDVIARGEPLSDYAAERLARGIDRFRPFFVSANIGSVPVTVGFPEKRAGKS